jgi:uncharacterized protein YaiI (UPF0178 family)
MTIYVDADACPVKDEIYRVARRYSLPVVLVANSPLRAPAGQDVTMVQVAGGPDVADDWIAEIAGPGDIVATADLPLAGRVLTRGAIALDFRGVEFTPDSIGGLLASREISQFLREMGTYSGGPKAMDRRARGRFAGKLDEVINRLQRRQTAP